MPSYEKHLAGGFATFIPLAFLLKQPTTNFSDLTMWLFFCLIGSLFPDIDTKSHIQKWIYAFALILIVIFYFLNRALSPLFLLLALPLLVRHRGLFHNPRFLLALAIFIAILLKLNLLKIGQNYWILALFFLLGAYSHLILDLGFKQFSRNY